MSGNLPNGGRNPEDIMTDWAIAGIRGASDYVVDPQTGRAKGGWQFVPVLAPALDAVADFREGNYAGAALNGVMAATDLLPMGSATKIARLGSAVGFKNLVKTDIKYRKSRDWLKKAGQVVKGQEVHHTVPVRGNHQVADWRNNILFLKPLSQAQHRRIHGKWLGEPRYNLAQRAWHGTTHWQKNIPAGFASYIGNQAENSLRSPPPTQRR